MKKIGICACYDTKNYGSMLQSFATAVKIEELGMDYEFIRYSRKLTPSLIIRSISRIPEFVKRFSNKTKMKKLRKIYPDVYDRIQMRNQCFDKFMRGKFHRLSPVYDTFKQLKEGTENYDAVLVGSDQLWRPEGYSTRFYNLLFVPDYRKKISYATSFGVSEIPKSKKNIATKFLKRIQYISVRELRAAELVEELTNRKAEIVADPTLLLTGEEWNKFISIKPVLPPKEKYIFCYLLGTRQEHRKAAEELKRATGYKIVTIPHLDEFVEEDVQFGDHQLFRVGPAEFVNLIRHAEYICTDSFHGTVFSILHHKKFITFDRFAAGSRDSRNSRIDSILSQTELQERRFSADIVSTIQAPINYEAVDDKLRGMREHSIRFLKNCMEGI